jgi:hypothetical protein
VVVEKWVGNWIVVVDAVVVVGAGKHKAGYSMELRRWR